MQAKIFHSIIVVTLLCSKSFGSFSQAVYQYYIIDEIYLKVFSKQEASLLRKEFWTVFGQYMKPVPSAEGEKINWLNYKTGEKNIAFKMNADNTCAIIAIEITHDDADLQQLYFEQFLQLKNMLLSSLAEEWTWKLHLPDSNGKIVSRIYKELKGNFFDKAKWPELISFFKTRIIALDNFWSTARYAFEALR